ncbi:hypothetical protein J2X81_002657 [Sinomonas atrocyanea]|nr:hypothetical protein [Sinomonas atrocyanea]MDR6622397.1 hypothetical protein [Sinomonas atrocyanea]
MRRAAPSSVLASATPVRFRGPVGRRVRRRALADAEHPRPGGEPRHDPGLGVLEDEALPRERTELRGCEEEALRVGLARGDQLRGDGEVGEGQPGGRHAAAREVVVRRGDEGVGDARERREEVRGARDRHHPGHVLAGRVEHAGLVGEVLGVRPVGQQQGHGEPALPAVDERLHGGPGEAVLGGPLGPEALHHGVGVHQGAVHVQQDGAGGDGLKGHAFSSWVSTVHGIIPVVVLSGSNQQRGGLSASDSV